jgi:polyhydroxybutyrate depolymerase
MMLALALPQCSKSVEDASSESQPETSLEEPSCRESFYEAGLHQLEVSIDGAIREALLYIPMDLPERGPYPLVLAFHGVYSSAESIIESTEIFGKADEEGFVVIVGRGVGGAWNAGGCCEPAQSQEVDDVAFVRRLVELVAESGCIDMDRVYATGFSNGAAMTYRLACEAADLIRAVAPVGGMLGHYPCSPQNGISLLAINAVDDPQVSYQLAHISYQNFRSFNYCGGTPVETEPAPGVVCESDNLCADQVTTKFCSIEELGHLWPGDPDADAMGFRATDALWEFFVEVSQ